MLHGGSQGGSSRAYAYAHIICVPCFLRNGSSGRMAGVWREGDDGKPGNGEPGLSERNGNYGTVHFRNKRGRKKRYLTFKKVKLTFLKVSRTLETGVFKALIVHFRNCFPCRGIHKRHGYLKEKSWQDGVEWNISRERKAYFGVFQRPLRFRWYGMYDQVRWRGVKEQVKDDHSPLK